MCTSGCGSLRAAATSRSCRAGRSSGSPFQNTEPAASMASWTFSGLVRFGWLATLGRSILTACVSNGAVMMKMTSSISITSISGIMLISAIGRAFVALVSNPPKAMLCGLFQNFRHGGARRGRLDLAVVGAGGEEGEHVVRESVELGEHEAV